MSDASQEAAPDDAADGAPSDPAREELLGALRADLGDALIEGQVLPGDLVIRVDRRAWRRTAELLKTKHGFEYFCFLSGIDWLKSTELSTRYEQVFGAVVDEDADEPPAEEGASPYLEGRVAGGDGRFSVFLRLNNIVRHIGITVKADLDDVEPSVDSLVTVFRGADWHERETWEMFGFVFDGHPSLRHIYLPTEFEGFPLRKDFPLLARAVKPWPGLVDKEPVPGEDDEETEEAS